MEALYFRVPPKHGGGRGTTEEPHIQPRHSTRLSVPPPYTPRHSKLVFIIKTKDQPLKEEWMKEEEIMLPIRFDFSSPFPYFSIMWKFVSAWHLHFFYFQHVCDSSSFCFPSPWIISSSFCDNQYGWKIVPSWYVMVVAYMLIFVLVLCMINLILSIIHIWN
jgi:hypothetical protein